MAFFTIAKEHKAGANPYDPLSSFDHIKALKAQCDYVIVLYHGGRYPSLNLQKTCSPFINKGADMIICQHSHCIGSYEQYQDKTIVNGQGNYLFNTDSNNEFWSNGMLIKVTISKQLEIDYIPVVKNDKGVRLANELEKKELVDAFYLRSKNVLNPDFLKKAYNEFSKQHLISYLKILHGNNFIFRVLNKLSNNKFIEKYYHQKRLVKMLNIIECEAHQELLITDIKSHLREKTSVK